MKRILLLLLTITLPLKSHALGGVGDTVAIFADLKVPIQTAMAASMAGMNTQLGYMMGLQTFNNFMAYRNQFEMNGIIGSALAATPEGALTMAASMEKTRRQIELLNQEAARLRENLSQEATIVDLDPRALWSNIKRVMSGDGQSTLVETAQRKFNQIKDKLLEQFTEKRLKEMAASFMEDILSCRTPQFDAFTPSIDIDFGLAMCDYKQMFGEMKDQVNTLSRRKLGDNFTINGEKIGDIIENPELLKETIEMVSPTQGEKLTLDFLSDLSMKASLQNSVDLAAVGQEIAQVISNEDLKFSGRSLMDAFNDSIRVQGHIAKSQAMQANTSNKLQSINNQITALEAKMRSEGKEEEKATRAAAAVSQSVRTN